MRLAGHAWHVVAALSPWRWLGRTPVPGLCWVCPLRTCSQGALTPVTPLRSVWVTSAAAPNRHYCGAGRGVWSRPDLGSTSALPLRDLGSVTCGCFSVCKAGGWRARADWRATCDNSFGAPNTVEATAPLPTRRSMARLFLEKLGGFFSMR